MFYTIYKITNRINNKYYIGMHKTKNLDDGYMGSGKLIKAAIKKYGKENFTKEILHIFDTDEEMKNAEKELVILNEQCYNLCEGGHGGFSYINRTKKNLYGKNGHEGYGKENLIDFQKVWNNYSEEQKNNHKQIISLILKEKFKNGLKNGFEGKTHNQKTKKEIGLKNSISQSGKRNSQYGSIWITNGTINKKIKKEDFIPDDWYKGRSLLP